MNHHAGKPKVLHCRVLRQADYAPGNWLLSDRFAELDLVYENMEVVVDRYKSRPDLNADISCLILAGERTAPHAVPLKAGAYTFGGNWLWSDAPEFPFANPIPIHDSPTPIATR